MMEGLSLESLIKQGGDAVPAEMVRQLNAALQQIIKELTDAALEEIGNHDVARGVDEDALQDGEGRPPGNRLLGDVYAFQ